VPVENVKNKSEIKTSKANLWAVLIPYKWQIALLVVLTIISNGFNLAVPKLISRAVDAFGAGSFVASSFVWQFLAIALFIFIFTYFQSLVQTYAAERVARDLRTKLIDKISTQEFQYIQEVTPNKLLTNLTSDVDAVKMFVSMAISSIVSSAFLIVGASILLLLIDWELGLAILVAVPIIFATFFIVMSKVRKLFRKSQEAIDWLNKVINESVLGSALIRLLNSQHYEYEKFLAANTRARDVSLSILRLFATLIPVITFATNLSTLVILALGGHFVITGAISLGDFTAFNSYLAILIFPIIIIGFMSNLIAFASAAYQRIYEVLSVEEKINTGKITAQLHGNLAVKNVTVKYGEKSALKNISFDVKAGTKIAIIGPTAAGKTQLLYLLIGLLKPTTGSIEYDGKNISEYNPVALHNQIGFVFQDSIIFNASLRENIGFSNTVKDEDLEKAITTAELKDFVETFSEKLGTVVSERGTSLSGGQKQRIMLARALALNPKILLLDDFTARVDTNTEQKILKNISINYPDLTLISVTQKIAAIENYDQVLVLMEGELLAIGTHATLMHSSPEYVQIYNSQQSTNEYELRPE